MRRGLGAHPRQFDVPEGFPPDVLAAAQRGRRSPPGDRARRPHRRPVRDARPGVVDRPRSGVLRSRRAGERPGAALRDRRRRPVRRRPAIRSTARRGGVAPRCTCPTAAPALYPPVLVRGRGQPAARRPTPGRGVRRPPRRRRHAHARRRRAGDHPQPGEARLHDGHDRRPPAAARASSPGGCGGRRALAARAASSHPSRRSRSADDGVPRRVPAPPLVGGVELGAVARHQPRGGRRAARRRHGAVPRDGRTRRASGPPAAPHGAGARCAVAPDDVARRAGADARRAATRSTAAFMLAIRRAGGGASYVPFAAGVGAVALGDGRHVRPRHRAAAPARRPLRDRRRAGGRQRTAGARPR